MSAPSRRVADRGGDRLGTVLALVGVLVTAWSLLGPGWSERRSLARLEAEPEQAVGPDHVPGYHTRLRSPRALLTALRSGAVPHDVEALNELVHASMRHGATPSIDPAQNWLAWTLGSLRPDLRLPQRADRLAQAGEGLCSDAVIVLAALASKAGFDAETVDLDGHVVAELRRGAEVWTADPSYGLVFRGPVSTLTRPAARARVAHAVRDLGHPEAAVEQYVAVLTSPEDDAVVPGGRLHPRLAVVERVLDVLAVLVPLSLVAFGLRRRVRSAKR